MKVPSERERRSTIRLSDLERVVEKITDIRREPYVTLKRYYDLPLTCENGCGYPVPTPGPCGECRSE